MDIAFPTRHFGGYIFDCDGTIADTMPLHYRAWARAMKDFGGTFPEDIFYAWGGKPTDVIVNQLNAMFGTSLDVAETVARKEGYYLESVHEVGPVVPVLEFARSIHGTAPMAIASGGHHELVDATLAALGITELFDAVVCAEDYVHGKPAPDPFLEAARRLQVPPDQCVVFEDSPTGIAAAEAAGMAHVFVPTAMRGREPINS
ncbi:HAD family phosphatase [Sphaerospermopsis aphanizomenoides BCCUSP55]|uniref:HAD family hydrolase n=1 Tax=Sphaerospermopsis aphanizomenoides TaxID=459663 RepID=UPI001904D973|nr:HAD family phosphatase [Sphaerospermopsis aphanizomenoides]MBK1990949.1 HAD family phosphatase [Sphaerospermopsis aphanizomenoides BCCUSP55]